MIFQQLNYVRVAFMRRRARGCPAVFFLCLGARAALQQKLADFTSLKWAALCKGVSPLLSMSLGCEPYPSGYPMSSFSSTGDSCAQGAAGASAGAAWGAASSAAAKPASKNRGTRRGLGIIDGIQTRTPSHIQQKEMLQGCYSPCAVTTPPLPFAKFTILAMRALLW